MIDKPEEQSPDWPPVEPWPPEAPARNLPQEHGPGWGFVPAWVLSTAVGLIVGTLVVHVATNSDLIYSPSLEASSLIAVGGTAAVIGLMVGLAQWFLLRMYLSNVLSWVLATAVGWGLMGTFSDLAEVVVQTWFNPYGPDRVIFTVLWDMAKAATGGGLLGLAKWGALILSSHVTASARKTASWPVVNLLSYIITAGVASALARVSISLGGIRDSLLLFVLSAEVLSFSVIALATGFSMRALLRTLSIAE